MSPERLVARDPTPLGAPSTNSIIKRAEDELNTRAVGGAIDTVNLNVSGEGVTMTFVETEAEDLEDEQ